MKLSSPTMTSPCLSMVKVWSKLFIVYKYENHSKENQISHVDRYTFCSFIREREFQSDCCEVPCVLVKYTCTQPEYRPATFDMSAYRLAYSLIKFSGNICFWYSLYGINLLV